jgi:hypothetical protein
MATKPKAKTSPAFQQLAATLGAKPPKGLSVLPARDLQHLNEQVEAALTLHQQTMAEAEASIVNHAPKPLRKTVRKILGV